MIATARHRAPLKPAGQALALLSASQHGASKTRLRQDAGMTAAQVRTALPAGELPERNRAAAAASNPPALDQCAVLAESGHDPGAVTRLIDCVNRGYGLEYEAARIRREYAGRARLEQAAADLAAAAVPVSDDLPQGAAWLTGLTHDGQDLTAASHAGCPGHGAVLPPCDGEPAWYCTSPSAHGHQPQLHPADPSPAKADPAARRHVTEGNRAWNACAGVRHTWLKDSLLGGISSGV